MPPLIYIVDDEPDILELVSMNLQKAGFKTRAFLRANPMLEALQTEMPALLILDLMLPDADGMDVCKQIRHQKNTSHIPILMLTARVDVQHKVKGLDYGADDYLTKPFSTEELIARIQAILRRTQPSVKSGLMEMAAGLIMDTDKFEVFVDGVRIDLTLTEFKLFKLLCQHPGKVYNRMELLDYLWGTDKIVVDRTIDVHMKNLRDKLGRFGDSIHSVRGIGYKFEL